MNRPAFVVLSALSLPLAMVLWPSIGAGSQAVQTPPAPTPPAAAPSTEPELDAAAELKKKGDSAGAAAAYESWAKAHPDHARLAEALCEAGVCWSSIAKSQQKDGRNTSESLESYKKSLIFYGQAVNTKNPAQGGRAQYLLGWNKYMMDDPAGAVAEYELVLQNWKNDAKYVPKALERRSMANRAMLRTAAAVADLERYAKDYPQGDDIEAVKIYRQYCTGFDKPAPTIVPQPWVQGDPTTLEALRGEVVALVFFATWCPSCEQARPILIDLHQRWEPFGVHVIGIVDQSQGQTPESVKGLLPQKGYKFPVMFDGTKRAFPAYGSNKIPNVVLIDRAGRVRWHDNPANLRDSTIEMLLAEEPPATKPSK